MMRQSADQAPRRHVDPLELCDRSLLEIRDEIVPEPYGCSFSRHESGHLASHASLERSALSVRIRLTVHVSCGASSWLRMTHSSCKLRRG